MEFQEAQMDCSGFWVKYEDILSESPQALFEYGIYLATIKNQTSEGFKNISQSKNMLISNLKSRFEMKNLVVGLDLGESDLCIAFIMAINDGFYVKDCN